MRAQGVSERRNRAYDAPIGVDRNARGSAVQGARQSWLGRYRLPIYQTEEEHQDSPGYGAAEAAGETRDPW